MSDRLQLLDVSVFGPLKIYANLFVKDIAERLIRQHANHAYTGGLEMGVY